MLAVRRLALAELDRHVRRGHLVAQQSMERFRLGGLEEVVVLVVVAERARDRPAAIGQVFPRILEHVELELGAGLERIARLGRALDLALQDRPGRDRDLEPGLLVDGVGQDHGRAGQPGEDPELVPDRFCDPVAVAGLPVHQLVPLGCIHLHVRAEQVRAEMRAVRDDPVEERLALHPLAHQAALHVRDGDHDRVDLAVADHFLELGQAVVFRGVALVVVAHGSASRSWRSPAVGEGRPFEPGRPSDT